MFFRNNITKKYKFSTLEAQRNPFIIWDQMHADGPMVPSKIMLIGKTWMTTSWDAANDVLRDQQQFARDFRRAGKKSMPGLAWYVPKQFRRLADNMLTYDQQDHRRLRSLVDQAFLKREVDSMRSRIESIAHEMIDQLVDTAQSTDGVVDWVPHFSRQFPLAVICEVLGLPDEDRPKFTKWFRSMTEVSSALGLFKVLPGIKKLLRYFDEQFEHVRKNPRPGLMSELVAIELDGDRLSQNELISMVFILLFAGHETTVHLINTGLYSLLNAPDQKQRLMEDWSRADTAVDEILRYNTPVQMAKPRMVVEDAEFYGVELKRGELVIPILGAANADPDKFDQPKRFDILRSPNPHLSFGSGVHICLGLKLAKAEVEIAFRQIFERFPRLSFANSYEDVQWIKRTGLRGIKSLPLRIE